MAALYCAECNHRFDSGRAPPCPNCGGDDARYRTESEHRVLEESDYKRMCLPRGYWSVRTRLVPKSIALQVAKYTVQIDRVVRGGYGLTFTGGPGVGKTAAAAVIAREATSHGKYAFFTTVSDLREYIRNRIEFDRDSTVLERVKEVPLLVLDALWKEPEGDHTLNPAILASIVETRVQNKRATIVTTRMSAAALAEAHPTLTSLLTGVNITLEVTGPNQRERRGHPIETEEPVHAASDAPAQTTTKVTPKASLFASDDE